LDGQFPGRLYQGCRNGVVTATGAERRQGAFVVPAGQTQLVLGQGRVGDLGFGNESHNALPGAGWPLHSHAVAASCGCIFCRGPTSSSTPSTMNAEEMGSPL